ncbi:hypothetical protein MBANPS3_007104 [Mucor bainieri]
MSVNNNGRTLPPETLLQIFSYAESDPNHQPSFFTNYQLVHRSWVRAAQIKLYSSVVLRYPQARAFVQTIQDNENVRDHVRKVVFSPGFVTFDTAEEMIQTIFARCPNIQEIYASAMIDQRLIWRLISTAQAPPQNIRIFHPLDQSAFYPRLYDAAAIACRQTLTQLQLWAKGTIDMETLLNDDNPLNTLIQRLPEFPSLNLIDFFVHRCTATLNGLQLQNLDPGIGDLVDPRLPPANVTELPTIRSLTIKPRYIPMHLLPALMIKFNRLDYLEMIRPRHGLLPVASLQFWWNTLTDLFMRPQRFCLAKDFEALEHARGFLDRTSAAPNLYKKLTISCLYRPNETNNPSQMVLKRGDATYDVSLYLFTKIRSYTTGPSWLNLLNQLQTFLNVYDAKDIQVTINSFDEIYNTSKIKKPNAAQTVNLAQYFPIQVDATLLRRVLKAGQKVETWLLLCLICNTVERNEAADPTGQVIIFDAALFIYPPYIDYVFPQDLQVSELHLRNSILYHATLPEISLRLPVITRLIINTCCIIMDSRYTLRVSFPTTRIQAIGLKLAPFQSATNTACDDDEICSLENYDLLEALSASKPLIFKFELEEQTYVVRKDADGLTLLGEEQHAMTTGTPDEFLIWIQCRDLDTLALDTSDKKWISWETKIRFKELQ